ncbi:hypothetical protein GH721_13945 [Kriegella sp. EG-1]|nr:hypothetical protein [Flavobacteriaceae bacterium EG-1]
MRYNLTKHKILKALANKLTAGMDENGRAVGDIKVSKSDIISLVGKNKRLYAVIISELRANNEVKYLEASDSYIIETVDGLNSFSNKKYLNKNWDIILSYLKNFAQIFIPIASLIVAILALWLKLNTQDTTHKKEIKKIESRLEVIEKSAQKNITTPVNQ